MAKKGSQLTVRTATEIQGGEFVILGYAGRSYQMTLDELKKFIGIIEADGGSVDLTQVTTDILPLADASKDIGSLEKRWKKVYSTALTVKAQSVDEEEVNIHDGGIEGILGRDIQWSIDGSGNAVFLSLKVNGADVATMDYFNNELSKYVTTDTLTKNYVSNTSLTEILKKYYESGYVDYLLSSKASTSDLNKTNTQLGLVRADVDTLKSYFQDTDDVDDIINKWRELEAFLAGQTETSTLAELLSVKADKETVVAINSRVTDLEDSDFVDIDSLRSTLESYYTKDEVDALLGEAGGVDLTGYVNEIAASGTGNGIASVSKDGSKLTFTKANFLTSHQSLDGYINSVSDEGSGNVVTAYRKSGKSLVLQKGLSVYSKAEVDELIDDISIPSLDGYVTNDALTESLNNLSNTYLSFRDGGTVSGATIFSGGLSVQNSLTLLGVDVAAGSSGLTFGGKIPMYSGDAYTKSEADKKFHPLTTVDTTPTLNSRNLVTSGGVAKAVADLAESADGLYQRKITSTNKLAYSLISGTPTLATVATSGSYNDLTNKPTIPSAITESTVSGWGFTKNAGTITGIKMNGASKGASGVVDLGTVLTSHQSIHSLTIKNSDESYSLTYTPNSSSLSITLGKSWVGLGNVENTKLSTWAGSTNITTLGTITSGTWNGTKIGQSYLDLSGYATQSWVEAKDYLSKYGDAANSLKLGGVNASDYALKADYLPLSGGKIYGELALTSTNNMKSLRFNTTSGHSWFFVRAGEWYVTNIGWFAEYRIIHSGNIGSQSVNYANGTADIWSKQPQLAAATESNAISIVDNSNGSCSWDTVNEPLASITKAIQFKWYGHAWHIGGIRGGGNFTDWFGITHDMGTPVLRVHRTGNNAYLGSNTLIHSGNIGSYAVTPSNLESTLSDYPLANGTRATGTWGIDISGGARRLISPYYYAFDEINVITNGTTADELFGDHYSFSAMMKNNSLFNGWATVWNFSAYEKYGGTQFAVLYNTQPVRAALRTYNQGVSGWGDWREIAFTDSTVAAAKTLVNDSETKSISVDNKGQLKVIGWGIGDNASKWQICTAGYIGNTSDSLSDSLELKNNNGIVLASYYIGLILNSSGNVTIGDSDLAGTSYKLYVNGEINITNNYKIGGLDVLRVRTDHLAIGEETAYYSSLPTKIYGQRITMQYGTNKTGGFILNESGNIGIGTTNPNTKLHVVGGAKIEGNLTVGDVTLSGSSGDLEITPSGNVIINGSDLEVGGSGSFTSLTVNTNTYLQGGSTNPYLRLLHNSTNFYVQAYNGSLMLGAGVDNSMWIAANGNVEVQKAFDVNHADGYVRIVDGSIFSTYGTSTSWEIMDDGSAYFAEVNTPSDSTKKNILSSIELTTSHIANAPAVSFTWKASGRKSCGTIAQYWKNVLPEVVSGEEGSYGMNYAVLGVVSSIILARNIETHEQRIARLEKEISDLQKELNALVNNE